MLILRYDVYAGVNSKVGNLARRSRKFFARERASLCKHKAARYNQKIWGAFLSKTDSSDCFSIIVSFSLRHRWIVFLLKVQNSVEYCSHHYVHTPCQNARFYRALLVCFLVFQPHAVYSTNYWIVWIVRAFVKIQYSFHSANKFGVLFWGNAPFFF